MKHFTALLLVFLTVRTTAFAQSVEVNDSGESNAPIQQAPGTGKDKATKYFQSRKGESPASGALVVENGGTTPHLLALHFGGFFQGQSYQWGDHEKQGA